MSGLITSGLGPNQKLATSGYGLSVIVPAEPGPPPVIIVPGPSVGTGGYTLDLPPRRAQGTRFVVRSVLLNMEPHIRGLVKKFFPLKVVRVSSHLEEHEENDHEVLVTAYLFGTDWDA